MEYSYWNKCKSIFVKSSEKRKANSISILGNNFINLLE